MHLTKDSLVLLVQEVIHKSTDKHTHTSIDAWEINNPATIQALQEPPTQGWKRARATPAPNVAM